MLLTSTTTISTAEFNAIKEVKIVTYQKQRKYDAKIWGSNETLAPTEELKMFDASKD